MQVYAVTVAYNSPRELRRLLLSLKEQKYPLTGLIVIDNSDELHSIGNKRLFELFCDADVSTYYLKTDTNVGSAGGFRLGMKIAHDKGCDWAWLLDQDGAVSPACLSELLRHHDTGDLLCPNIVDVYQHDRSEPFVYAKNFLGGQYIAPRRSEGCRIDTIGTHAVLVSKKTLDAIGYYDDSLFFVGYEDTDYGYRAVKAGLVISFVASATALHPFRLPQGKKFKIFPAQLNLTILPADMGYAITLPPGERPCSKSSTRSIAIFSKAYLESKYLKSWQFAAALIFSEGLALYRKVRGNQRISLTLTLRIFLRCLSFRLRNEWPYDNIEALCRAIIS